MQQLLINAGAYNKELSGLGFKEPNQLLGIAAGDKYKEAIRNIYDQGKTVDEVAKSYIHLQDEIKSTGHEIDVLSQSIQKDKNKEERAPVKGAHKLLGPEDHEEPYRLPWYLGPDAAEDFANQAHGQRAAGLPSATGGMFNRGSASTGQSASVEVNTTISPQFVFNGVPADIQAFMRDHAEPELAKDIELNARGITTKIVESLKRSGMAVTVG
jgi:hypothetical protein